MYQDAYTHQGRESVLHLNFNNEMLFVNLRIKENG